MSRYSHALIAFLALAACAYADVDWKSFKTDAEADRWLQKNSATYAAIVKGIKARKDIRGYRIVSKADIKRGMAAWVGGTLEIQLNPKLTGADRANVLIFEMVNAGRQADHAEVDAAADRGLIKTAGEFGLAHEMLEFEALRTHRQILVEIEPRAGPLPKAFFYFVTPAARSLKEYRLPLLSAYLKAQKDSGHTEHYYKHYRLRKAGRRARK